MTDSLEHREVPLAAYSERRRIEPLTDLTLARLAAARRALIAHGGAYGAKTASGGYFKDSHSVWQVFEVTDDAGDIDTVVLWKEVDDGRFSFHFAADESEPRFFCYEN